MNLQEASDRLLGVSWEAWFNATAAVDVAQPPVPATYPPYPPQHMSNMLLFDKLSANKYLLCDRGRVRPGSHSVFHFHVTHEQLFNQGRARSGICDR